MILDESMFAGQAAMNGYQNQANQLGTPPTDRTVLESIDLKIAQAKLQLARCNSEVKRLEQIRHDMQDAGIGDVKLSALREVLNWA